MAGMPVRRYRVIAADGSEAELLEVDQPLASPDLTRHPLDGRELRKLAETPSLGGRWSERALGDKLRQGGFRRMERDGETWRDVT